jgi:hypothetical protein
MAYTAEISRTNPTSFVFVVDQSASMNDPFAGRAGNKKKAEGVADALNRLLQTLVLRCAKSEGVRDYFHVGVVGYGSRVGSAFGGPLAGRDLVPVSELADNPLRLEQRTRKVDDGAGSIVEQTIKFPVWVEPVADGNTPMCRALARAQDLVTEFTDRSPQCFPPIVLNISDGEANDGDPEAVAQALECVASADGNVLLFNAHISSRPEQAVEFPDDEQSLADEHARLLFRMSSVLPPRMQETARREGFRVSPNTRGFVFNADLVSVIRFLDIGTRVDARNLR